MKKQIYIQMHMIRCENIVNINVEMHEIYYFSIMFHTTEIYTIYVIYPVLHTAIIYIIQYTKHLCIINYKYTVCVWVFLGLRFF
jgi:hypothetical protein